MSTYLSGLGSYLLQEGSLTLRLGQGALLITVLPLLLDISLPLLGRGGVLSLSS